ncbi:MAG: ammonium transporter [Halobacteriaceae archaeon]
MVVEPLQTSITAIADSIYAVWVLVICFLIFFMQPGFALLEAGQVRARNAANVFMKNLMDWALGVLVFFLLGSGLATVVAQLTSSSALDVGAAFAYLADPAGGSMVWINWFFGAVFAMTAATIVSGAVAGRMNFGAYVATAIAMTAIIYPVALGLTWKGGLLSLGGGGYLAEAIGAGYQDFAGATVVHALGGIAGLTAAKMIGPRRGRFDSEGNSQPIPGHSVLLAMLGTLFLAFGWYGFNVGTQATVLSGTTLSNMAFQGQALGRVLLNTTLAMGVGAVASTAVTTVWEGKPDPLFAANGLLAGLVAITGACAHVTWYGALAIGLIGGLQTPFVYRWVVDSLKIDDVCGVFAVHGSAGFIGTILIPVFDTAGFSMDQFVMQIAGSAILGTWGVVGTIITLSIVGLFMDLRVSESDEIDGLDQSEHGLSAYPEFAIEEVGGSEPVADGGTTEGDA